MIKKRHLSLTSLIKSGKLISLIFIQIKDKVSSQFSTIDIKKTRFISIKNDIYRGKMNEIVKHRNELNDFELGNFLLIVKSIYISAYKIKDKDKVVISYDRSGGKLDLPKSIDISGAFIAVL